jgi:hypothetical protein
MIDCLHFRTAIGINNTLLSLPTEDGLESRFRKQNFEMELEGLVLYGLAVVLIISLLLSSLMLKRATASQRSVRVRSFTDNLLVSSERDSQF